MIFSFCSDDKGGNSTAVYRYSYIVICILYYSMVDEKQILKYSYSSVGI